MENENKIQVSKEEITTIVENHKGEEFLLFKEDEKETYNATTIKVGYYCPQKDEVYGDIANWGFTQDDIENGEIEPGIFVIEYTGSSSVRNADITPLFRGYNTIAEEKTNWVRALVYEARTSWFKAPNPGTLNQQGWGSSDIICKYCNKCKDCI